MGKKPIDIPDNDLNLKFTPVGKGADISFLLDNYFYQNGKTLDGHMHIYSADDVLNTLGYIPDITVDEKVIHQCSAYFGWAKSYLIMWIEANAYGHAITKNKTDGHYSLKLNTVFKDIEFIPQKNENYEKGSTDPNKKNEWKGVKVPNRFYKNQNRICIKFNLTGFVK